MLRVGARGGRFAPTLLAWPAAMATEQPIYDLILLLDPEAEEERRTNILASLEQIIDRQGTIVSRHDWGLRPTAYELHKRGDADYHLLQFQGTAELLNQLNHALKITDGVNRFRIIKLRKGTPEPPDLTMSAVAAAAAAEQPAEIER
jgi:small subunit ribosomal protein S6